MLIGGDWFMRWLLGVVCVILVGGVLLVMLPYRELANTGGRPGGRQWSADRGRCDARYTL